MIILKLILAKLLTAITKVKKLKVTLVQALRLCTGRTAHTGSRGIALPFHDHGIRRGWTVSVTHRSLFTPGKTRYPLYKRLLGPKGRFGQVRKILHPPGFDPRTVQPVASSYTDYDTRPTPLARMRLYSSGVARFVIHHIWCLEYKYSSVVTVKIIV